MFNVFKELLQLPIELISRFVLSKLSWKDLSALDIAISNKNKRGQYCDWMNLYCCDYELRMTTSHCFLKWLKLRKVCIKSLSIERSMDDTVLHLFSQMGLKVDSISLVFCEFLSADAITDFLDSVECRSSITIYTSNSLGTAQSWKTLLERNTALAYFELYCHSSEIGNSIIGNAALNCKNIKLLDLQFFKYVNDKHIELLAKNCRHLTGLSLGQCETITDASLFSLGDHCLPLAKLNLDAIEGSITDSGYIFLIQRCRRLTELSLWDCSELSARSFAAMSSQAFCAQQNSLSLRRCKAFSSSVDVNIALGRFRKLRTLDFNYCANISEEQIITMINNNTKILCTIELHSVSTATNAIVSSIANNCLELMYLTLSKCTQVSDISVLALCAQLKILRIFGCPAIPDKMVLHLKATFGSGTRISVEY